MNIKALIEKKNSLLLAMDAILTKVSTETRAMTDEETADYNAKDTEVKGLIATIAAMEAAEKRATGKRTESEHDETAEEKEYRAFYDYITTGEIRADNNMTTSKNGAVIPTSIANKIVETVKELSPIYSKVTILNVKGTLNVPVWGDDDTDNITFTYASEYTRPDSHAGKFTNISLGTNLASGTVVIPKSLINNAVIDAVNFIIRKVAESIAEFYEKELVAGTGATGHLTGATSATSAVTAASATAIAGDELIELQMSIPEQYQSNACWLMNKSTLTKLRKLKDSNGDYLLNRDITTGFGWSILGKPVMISDNMPTAAAGNKAIVYGDFSGIYLKISEAPNIQVLNEVYAEKHAIGITAWTESDSKIVESQKLRLLTMAAS